MWSVVYLKSGSGAERKGFALLLQLDCKRLTFEPYKIILWFDVYCTWCVTSMRDLSKFLLVLISGKNGFSKFRALYAENFSPKYLRVPPVEGSVLVRCFRALEI